VIKIGFVIVQSSTKGEENSKKNYEYDLKSNTI